MMDHKINMAIQVLPRAAKIGTYELVDVAIGVIQKSGLKYRVCPFETVVEGYYEELMNLLRAIHKSVYENGAEEMITNIKIQTLYNQDINIEDKMNKYE